MPALTQPVSGSFVTTKLPVPMYLPPSFSCHLGTGNEKRSTSSPSALHSKMGDSCTILGATGFITRRRERHSSRPSSGRAQLLSIPSAVAVLPYDSRAFVRTLNPLRQLLIESNNKAGDEEGLLAKISVIPPISRFQSAPSMRLMSCLESSMSMNSLRSL